MTKWVPLKAVVILLLVGHCLFSVAQEVTPPFRVGVVDLELVGQKFGRKIEEEESLTQWYVQEQNYLRELGKYIFCSAAEWEEVARLLRIPKAQRDKAQQDRLNALLEQSTQRETEFQNLRTKQASATLTADEDGRLKILGEIGSTRDADLSKRIDELERELSRRMAQIREELMKPVREAVNAVAAQKGLTLILEKDWVYFGGEDVTEDVIKLVNDTAPPRAGTTAPASSGEKPKEGEGEKPAESGGTP